MRKGWTRIWAGIFCLPLLWLSANASAADSAAAASSYEIVARDPNGLTPTLAARKLLSADSPLRVRWALPLFDRMARRLTVPELSANTPYFLVETVQNDLLAINNDDGHARWWVTLPQPIKGKIFISEKFVYFTMGNRLVALEKNTGDMLWNVQLPFAPSSGPAVNETPQHTFVFLPSYDRSLYCLEVVAEDWSPKTTAPRAKKFGVQLYHASVIWRYSLKGVAQNEPVYDPSRNFVFASSLNKDFYGIDFTKTTETGAIDPDRLWIFHTQRGISASPILNDDKIIFVSEDQTIYAVNGEGELQWKYVAAEPLKDTPQIVYDNDLRREWLVQTVGENSLLALDNNTGLPQWQHQGGSRIVGMTSEKNLQENLRAAAITIDSDGFLSALRISARAPLPLAVVNLMKKENLSYDKALNKVINEVAQREKLTFDEAQQQVIREEKATQIAKRERVSLVSALKTVAEAERVNKLLQRDNPAEIAWRVPAAQFALFAGKSYGVQIINGETFGNDYIFCTTADRKTLCVLEDNR